MNKAVQLPTRLRHGLTHCWVLVTWCWTGVFSPKRCGGCRSAC